MKMLFAFLFLIALFSCEKASIEYDKIQETDSISVIKKDTLYYDDKCGCVIITGN